MSKGRLPTSPEVSKGSRVGPMPLNSLITEGRALVETAFERLQKHKSLTVRSYAKVMTRVGDRDRKKMIALWDGMVASPGDVQAARVLAKQYHLDGTMASWHGRKLKAGEKYPTGQELFKAASEEVKVLRARAKKAAADAGKNYVDPRLGPRGSF